MWYQQSPAEGDTTHCISENHLCSSFVTLTLLIFKWIIFDPNLTVTWMIFSVFPRRISQFLPLTCWALWRDRPPVKGRTVPGDGPNLAGSPDRDGLERLVGSHMEPRGSLRDQNSFCCSYTGSIFTFIRIFTFTSMFSYLSTGIRHKGCPPAQGWRWREDSTHSPKHGKRMTHHTVLNLFIGCL